MGYRYLDEITWADTAFEATGDTLEELFRASARATVHVMVSDPDRIEARERVELDLAAEAVDALLHQFLEKLIFYKDARSLLLLPGKLDVRAADGSYRLSGELLGEALDPAKHQLATDVKAVTFHRFEVIPVHEGWKATVVLDV